MKDLNTQSVSCQELYARERIFACLSHLTYGGHSSPSQPLVWSWNSQLEQGRVNCYWWSSTGTTFRAKDPSTRHIQSEEADWKANCVVMECEPCSGSSSQGDCLSSLKTLNNIPYMLFIASLSWWLWVSFLIQHIHKMFWNLSGTAMCVASPLIQKTGALKKLNHHYQCNVMVGAKVRERIRKQSQLFRWTLFVVKEVSLPVKVSQWWKSRVQLWSHANLGSSFLRISASVGGNISDWATCWQTRLGIPRWYSAEFYLAQSSCFGPMVQLWQQ